MPAESCSVLCTFKTELRTLNALQTAAALGSGKSRESGHLKLEQPSFIISRQVAGQALHAAVKT